MNIEKAYDFRKKLLTVHEGNLYDKNRKKTEEEILLCTGTTISVDETAGDVMRLAAEDFADFLKVSMGISAAVVSKREATINLFFAEKEGVDLGQAARYKGFKIVTEENSVNIYSHDERGAAQALFYIEDCMSFEKAPILKKGTISKYPMFSPQIVHSGYGLETFPDNYLMKIAHEGRDAVIFDVYDLDEKTLDNLKELISRTLKYGIDVYAYMQIKNKMHPLDDGAEQYYNDTYGKIFRECPGVRGIILVGESLYFPSRDPHVCTEIVGDGGIPSEKKSPAQFPCSDYADFLALIKKIIFKYDKDADIIFWTYNWGYESEEDREKLIGNIPDDISLEATYEMFSPKYYDESVGICEDYTLSFAGPGDYFVSEAKATKKRENLRLYSMTNTGGLTWDFGDVPYQPMPYQWMKRFEGMRRAYDEWGLCGIMESHHYGFYPSFISKLAKHAFFEPRESMEMILEKILKAEFGKKAYDSVKEALKLYSDAICYYTPSDSDQYGAMRVGPSYPFWFTPPFLRPCPNIPPDPEFPDGNRVCSPIYLEKADNKVTPIAIRIKEEIASLEIMLSMMEKGLLCLSAVKKKNEKLLNLINLSQFMISSLKTGINAKKWYILTNKARVAENKEALSLIYQNMEELLRKERKNAEDSLPLVDRDSRLGWEPYMHYLSDRAHIEWKIRQVDYMLNVEIPKYKCGLKR